MAGERTLPGGKGIKAFWTPGSNGWNTDNDINWRIVSAILQGTAISATTELPGSGETGDIYIVPTGDANSNAIAVWDGASGSEDWVYITPQEGWQMYVTDSAERLTFNGTTWSATASGALADVHAYTGNDLVVEYQFENDTISSDLTFDGTGSGAGVDWFITDVLADPEVGATKALRSADIGHSEYTYMQFTVDADAATMLRVRNRVACEGSDRMQIWIDPDGLGYDFVLERLGASNSGTWAWSEVDLSSYSGEITVRVQYTKDVSGNSSYDSIFVSQVDLVYPANYDKGAVVSYRGRVWVSLESSNTDVPDQTSTKWAAIGYVDNFHEEETGTSYTLVEEDLTGGVVKEMNNAGTITVTVAPDLESTGSVTFVQMGAGGISFAEGSGVTILSNAGKLATGAQYTAATLVPKGSNTFLLLGALV